MYSPVLLLCLLSACGLASPLKPPVYPRNLNDIRGRNKMASDYMTKNLAFRDISVMASVPAIYPQKAAEDALFSISEATLRAAIKIPASFTFGQKMPVILGPGTGVTGTQTFSGNFLKQFSTVNSTLDPIVLDIPDNLLDDIQGNAEFYSYSVNYVSFISNNAKVSVITWSQGSMDMQWALKYWPSTRTQVNDFIPISPDLKGSNIVDFSGIIGDDIQSIVPIAPALSQQKDTSNFIKTLRANGGDSAYVPTTAIWSSADEIVMPQTNDPTGSGWFNDARNVGVSNTEVQVACPNQPAGGPFSHEGMLYNPISFALAMDALTNTGPGLLSRVDLASVCANSLSPGLTADDKSTTDGTIPEAAGNILLYSAELKGEVGEPGIKAYAAKDAPAGAKLA